MAQGEMLGATQRHHYIETSKLCVQPHMFGLQVRPGVGAAHAAQHAGRLSQDAPDHVDRLLLCRHQVDRRSNQSAFRWCPCLGRAARHSASQYRLRDGLCRLAISSTAAATAALRSRPPAVLLLRVPPAKQTRLEEHTYVRLLSH